MTPKLAAPQMLEDADLARVTGGAGVRVAPGDLDGDGVADVPGLDIPGTAPPEEPPAPPETPPGGAPGGVTIG